MTKYPSYKEKTKPFELMFHDEKPYANGAGMENVTSTSKRYCRKINLCTETRTTPPLHVNTTRQGPHTTVNGVNTVNMVNGTVNIGDFNAKNARSTHQDADESTLGLRG